MIPKSALTPPLRRWVGQPHLYPSAPRKLRTPTFGSYGRGIAMGNRCPCNRINHWTRLHQKERNSGSTRQCPQAQAVDGKIPNPGDKKPRNHPRPLRPLLIRQHPDLNVKARSIPHPHQRQPQSSVLNSALKLNAPPRPQCNRQSRSPNKHQPSRKFGCV